jgi:Putative transmembrane protein (PGPGW)
MVADVKDLARLLCRVAVTVAGTVILAVGVVLLVTPGPGLVVIALALTVSPYELHMVYTCLSHRRSELG